MGEEDLAVFERQGKRDEFGPGFLIELLRGPFGGAARGIGKDFEIEQSGGGGIVVLEPGQRYDATRDHLFVVGWDGPAEDLVVNGDSLPAPRVLAKGVTHRLRFVFIGAVNGHTLTLADSAGPVTWRAVARDGYEMPAAQRELLPAQFRGWAGQTWDFEFQAARPGVYRLTLGDPAKPAWAGELVVR
mgnify:CR=1 FL=1